MSGSIVNLRALPVGRGAELALLLRDAPAALVLPLPHALDELRAPEVVARLALARELPLDDDLRRDARVIDARLPQRVVAAHAVPADEHVFDGRHERMPHVQRARDVGRRHRDAVDRALVVGIGARVERRRARARTRTTWVLLGRARIPSTSRRTCAPG